MEPHAACRVLGVPPGASEADIKSAYRNAALKFHPDRNAGLGADAERVAAEHFRRASEAYDVLSSPGGRYASRARRSGAGDPSQGRKSGYYNGAADPFGFQHRHSARVGDHMRRIDGNIRALYATLAVVGVMLYLAPQPKSPAETARRRRHTDRSTHSFTERAVTSLAPGSPLDTKKNVDDARRRDAFPRRRDAFSKTISSSLVDDHANRTVDHRADDVFGTRFRYAYEGGGEWKGPVLFAADAARDARASAKASFSRRYGSAGERAHASRRSNGHEKTETDEDEDDKISAAGPEWARGGYVGRGVSRRVLPYRRRRLGGGGGGGFGEDDVSDDDDSGSSRGLFFGGGIACARCRGALPLTARFCSLCGARVTSPASVVEAAEEETSAGFLLRREKKITPSATPLADPQDTGSSAGRGRARAAADREANARAEAG